MNESSESKKPGVFLSLSQLFTMENLFVTIPPSLVGYVFAPHHSLYTLFLFISVVVLLTFFVDSLNNYSDWEIDSLNKKRIEMRLRYDRKQVARFVSLTFVLLIFVLFFTPWQAFALATFITY